MNHSLISFHAQHNGDQLALSYLEDLWVERDAKEPRCFTIEFVGATSCAVWAGDLRDYDLAFQRKQFILGQSAEKGIQACTSFHLGRQGAGCGWHYGGES
jgi:hypothetical protein